MHKEGVRRPLRVSSVPISLALFSLETGLKRACLRAVIRCFCGFFLFFSGVEALFVFSATVAVVCRNYRVLAGDRRRTLISLALYSGLLGLSVSYT